MKPIDEIKRADLIDAFEVLKKSWLLNSDFKTKGKTKEDLIESFAVCVEEAHDSGKDIPDSIILFYNDIFSEAHGDKDYKNIKDCKGPMYFVCEDCLSFEECLKGPLSRYLNIPHWVLDYSLKILSRSAFKIFLYLCQMTDHRAGSNHFSRCWLNYNQIKNVTGVKSVRKYLKEIEEKGLIEHKYTVVGSPEGPKTIHQFTVNWYKKRAKFKKAAEVR
jgi:hypothetical protein